ncbi:MAG: DUF3857 domain-containing protein, partial [bacterium]|nr:DUF3857 domain-containing protein [bacterium]
MIPNTLGLPLAVALFFTGITPAQEVTQSPTPAWVSPIESPAPRDDATGPTELLLLDMQTNAAVDPVENYIHVVGRVLNQEGVEAKAQLSFSFDPSYQKLILHGVTIRRGSEVFDRLDMNGLQVIQREKGLEALQYDGRKTALCFIEDVRVGDIVEYSFTRTGTSPVFGKNYHDVFPLQFGEEVRHNYLRLVWPDSRPLNMQTFGNGEEPKVSTQGANREYTWEQTDVPRAKYEEGAPSWYDAAPYVAVSEYKDWADVAQWGSDLFEAPGLASAEVAAIAREI